MNTKLFQTMTLSKKNPFTAVNEAGGRAYNLTDEHALIQYVVTGCFSNTFYATADEQLEKVKDLASRVKSVTLAKLAVYAHETAKMKDTPAYLLAVLAARGETELLRKVFNRVITNSKMLCNFVQIIRSGVTGRKSFGTSIKKLIQEWIADRTGEQLFKDSIGHSNPSFADIIKMVHPKPSAKVQNAMFGYILGKNYESKNLPKVVTQFEKFKKDNDSELPDVPFRVLTNCNLTKDHWKKIAKDMPWNTLRMNLNMLARNGVYEDNSLTRELAAKLGNRELVRKANAFPYQLLTTYQHTEGLPSSVTLALQDALEAATENVPSFGENVAVCVDTSGSMGSAITGNRGSVTSKTRCVDVAGLIAACVVRTNQESVVLPFDTSVHNITFNPRDSVMTNARLFARNGGGTDCSCAVRELNQRNWKGNLVIMVSDNQSWADFYGRYRNNATGLQNEWNVFKRRNPKAKLVLIDLQPYTTTQVSDNKDVLNVGGWSDEVFTVIDNFVKGKGEHFVDVVNAVEV